MIWLDGLQLYIDSKDDVTESTLRFNQDRLAQLRLAAQIEGLERVALAEITLPHLLQVCTCLRTNREAFPIKPTTVKKTVAFLRYGFNWLYHTGLTPLNPASALPKMRKVKATPMPGLPPETVERILAQPARTQIEARDLAIFALLCDSGIRVAECSWLRQSDLNLHDELVYVQVRQGKGDKARTVSIGTRTRTMILAYLKFQNREHQPDQLLFLTKNGNRMTTRNIETRIARLGDRVGVHVTPHMLRVTFATEYARQRKDSEGLCYLLGHDDYAMSQRYIRMAEAEQARRANATASLVDSLTPASTTPVPDPNLATLTELLSQVGGLQAQIQAILESMEDPL